MTTAIQADNWRGHINRFIPPNTFGGWAVDLHDADKGSLDATVRLRGVAIGHGKADIFRPDLKQFGNGCFGFEIACQQHVPPSAMLSGDLDILISRDDVEYGALQIDGSLCLFVTMLEISRLIGDLSRFDAHLLRIRLNHATEYIPGSEANILGSLLTLLKNDQRLLPDTVAAFDKDLVSGIFLKTGIISSDQTAILGRDGHLFLVEGSNKVLELYDRPFGNDASVDIANQWVRLMAATRSTAEDLGSRFVQIVIPDKNINHP